MIRDKKCLGIEFGSTRIKAVVIDESYRAVSLGDYTWRSSYRDGIWTYSLDEVWTGLKSALSGIDNLNEVAAVGVSAMMHGYLAFDKDWNLLTPFRTWQNTITREAAEELTALFNFNIPQRWSVAHLYQAILNNEPHVREIAHITTLAGYVHYMLTGVNALGVGDASGMFPIDSETNGYDGAMLDKFDALASSRGFSQSLRRILPRVLRAGESAGTLSEAGNSLIGNLLPAGVPFAPAEGDAGTGMTATNSVAPRTGNVSAGTSIFSMVVLERPLKRVHPEIDIVTTPTGRPVAMVHCNNCTSDMNAWTGILREAVSMFGEAPDEDELFTRLYKKSLDGEPDCGGVTVINYTSGEGVTHFDSGRPLVVRAPDSNFTLANFLRAQLYSTMSTLKIGMDILSDEGVAIDSLTGHGGLFKTPDVGNRYMAAACGAPITCMETAGDGGPYGMAILAAFLLRKEPGESLEEFLSNRVFSGTDSFTVRPDDRDVDGFNRYIARFRAALYAEREAVERM